MPVLLLALLVGVLLYMWVVRRGSTLTRQCRWRLDRDAGEGVWRCAACGGMLSVPAGRPKVCHLREGRG